MPCLCVLFPFKKKATCPYFERQKSSLKNALDVGENFSPNEPISDWFKQMVRCGGRP